MSDAKIKSLSTCFAENDFNTKCREVKHNMKKRKSIIAVLFLFCTLSLSMSVLAASNYKQAYKKVVNGIEQKSSLEYTLAYIDKNKIPELVCSSGGGAFTAYTYKHGKAKCLINNGKDFKDIKEGGIYWRFTSGAIGTNFYYYIPKKNMLYCRYASKFIDYVDEDTHKFKDIFFKIKNGRFEHVESIIYDISTVNEVFSSRKNYKLLIGKYSYWEFMKKLS